MRSEKVVLKSSEKVNILGNLSTMLSSSIPLLSATETLLEDSKGNIKFFLETLKNDIVAGKRVNTTFSKFPKSFDRVVVNLIRAAEESGTLETTLKDIKDNVQKEAEFADKIKSAMMYPLIIFFVLMGIMLMILIVVVPKIATVFTRLRVTLPFATKMMIAASDFLVHRYYYVLFGLVVISLITFYLFKEKKQLISNIFVRLPLISQLSKKIDLTRFARSLSLLLSSGLPISSALELSGDVIVNQKISAVIKQSREMLSAGKQFSSVFKNHKNLIPSMMVKLIEVGEKSGSLEKSMQDVSEHMDYEVSKDLKTITTLIEPIMLIIVSLAVGGMMISIIGPIYSMISQVGKIR